LTTPLDLDLITQEPLVLTRTLRVFDTAYPVPNEVRGLRRSIGGIVKRNGIVVSGVHIWQENSAMDGSLSDSNGRFVLESVPEGAVALRVVEPGGVPVRVVLQVPSDDYDIRLERQNVLEAQPRKA
jgi:hypothetical protein